jgi:hypothetical protein
MLTSAKQPDRGEGEPALASRGRRLEHDEILRESQRQCRRDARVHDQKALPPVEKRDALAPGLPEIDVRTSPLREPPRELAERERARENERAAGEPEAQGQRGRAERPDELRGRQKDPDADRMTDHEGRRRPESELGPGGLGIWKPGGTERFRLHGFGIIRFQETGPGERLVGRSRRRER